MRVALTGTPGTGKTTVAELLVEGNGDADADIEVVHLNDAVREQGLTERTDEERGSLVVDLEAVAEWLADRPVPESGTAVVESHFAHLFDVDRVVVLRCHPAELIERLEARAAADRHDPPKSPEMVARSAEENAEAEALDVVLAEAVDRHGEANVYEVDTTGRDPDVVGDDVRAVIRGASDSSAGDVDFTEWLV
jgi:adenylate kinase